MAQLPISQITSAPAIRHPIGIRYRRMTLSTCELSSGCMVHRLKSTADARTNAALGAISSRSAVEQSVIWPVDPAVDSYMCCGISTSREVSSRGRVLDRYGRGLEAGASDRRFWEGR